MKARPTQWLIETTIETKGKEALLTYIIDMRAEGFKLKYVGPGGRRGLEIGSFNTLLEAEDFAKKHAKNLRDGIWIFKGYPS